MSLYSYNYLQKNTYFENKVENELLVYRTPIEGKYYEATIWTRQEGIYPNVKCYTKESTPRTYVGQYLRHEKIGYGDGADHWAVFLRDNEEIKVEYTYEGTTAWYEVNIK